MGRRGQVGIGRDEGVLEPSLGCRMVRRRVAGVLRSGVGLGDDRSYSEWRGNCGGLGLAQTRDYLVQ